ncbi:PadR family transcriptional regulator [Priestia megaterium]|uniref:PadR family transcriptional regulator n=1 Tax=Priestia aryabhattai TaxID=412384 RepID=UPI001178C568|nr:PadR family transcriptional regulator [Priestia aryabhattai]
MNTLGYAILSVLARHSCSGYDLANHLEVIWPAKHSQVYPLLKKLEDENFLTCEYVEQLGKPDKKLYSITLRGEQQLTEWLNTNSSAPVIRDEFLVKMYSIWLSDQKKAENLIQNRIDYLSQELQKHLEQTVIFEMNSEQKELNITSKNFGKYIVTKRAIKLNEDEIGWCRWILNLISQTNNKQFLLGIAGVKMINQFILGIV